MPADWRGGAERRRRDRAGRHPLAVRSRVADARDRCRHRAARERVRLRLAPDDADVRGAAAAAARRAARSPTSAAASGRSRSSRRSWAGGPSWAWTACRWRSRSRPRTRQRNGVRGRLRGRRPGGRPRAAGAAAARQRAAAGARARGRRRSTRACEHVIVSGIVSHEVRGGRRRLRGLRGRAWPRDGGRVDRAAAEAFLSPERAVVRGRRAGPARVLAGRRRAADHRLAADRVRRAGGDPARARPVPPGLHAAGGDARAVSRACSGRGRWTGAPARSPGTATATPQGPGRSSSSGSSTSSGCAPGSTCCRSRNGTPWPRTSWPRRRSVLLRRSRAQREGQRLAVAAGPQALVGADRLLERDRLRVVADRRRPARQRRRVARPADGRAVDQQRLREREAAVDQVAGGGRARVVDRQRGVTGGAGDRRGRGRCV